MAATKGVTNFPGTKSAWRNPWRLLRGTNWPTVRRRHAQRSDGWGPSTDGPLVREKKWRRCVTKSATFTHRTKWPWRNVRRIFLGRNPWRLQCGMNWPTGLQGLWRKLRRIWRDEMQKRALNRAFGPRTPPWREGSKRHQPMTFLATKNRPSRWERHWSADFL